MSRHSVKAKYTQPHGLERPAAAFVHQANPDEVKPYGANACCAAQSSLLSQSDRSNHRRWHRSLLTLIFSWLCGFTLSTEGAEPEVPDALLGLAPSLAGRSLQYFEGHDATQGYLSLPQGEIKGGVILIHEWNGLSQRIRETADAFAAEGYAALAADLYKGRTGSHREENMQLVRETQANPELIIENLNAAVQALKQQSGVTRVATIGWCFGGGIALSYALGGETHEGTAIFYGRLVTDPEQLRAIDHEIYGTFAGLDRGPSVDQVNAFVSAMRTAGIKNDVHIYDDVNHGFWLHADQDLDVRLAPAADAWRRLKAYLGRVL
ncbi:MAG: dienelactone hydrolase family protein [Pseudomonadales bacterium]